MSNFVIIPDTACDLTADLRERFGVVDYLKGIIYFPDGHDEAISLDWDRMTPEEYFDSMKGRKAIYKTASIPYGTIIETYEKYLKQGLDILGITLSTGLSSTYSECSLAAGELLKKYPDRKIILVDSLRYSTALALLIIKACEKQQSGATLEETAEYTESIKNKIHQMGPMDDLFFLCKTGRVNNFQAFFGSIVGINPMADFSKNGKSEVLIKTKGKKSAFEALIKYMEKTIEHPEDQIIFVAHSNRQKQAEALAQMIREKFNPKEIIINPVGMACGASIGPGLCAAFYMGSEISDDMVKEKAIMNEIAKEIG